MIILCKYHDIKVGFSHKIIMMLHKRLTLQSNCV